jgi:predicted HicB family RNase H-like nuclease
MTEGIPPVGFEYNGAQGVAAAESEPAAACGEENTGNLEALLHAGAVASVRRERSKGGSVMLRLPESWVEALGALAAEQGISTVDLVRTCIEIGLGLPDGAMTRAKSEHTHAAKARYRALAVEAARRVAVVQAEATLEAHRQHLTKLARGARTDRSVAFERLTPPAVATLHARRDTVSAEELLASAQAAALETQEARSYAAQAKADHAARLGARARCG